VRTAALDRSPAIGLVGAGAVSVQFGAALATRLFARVGPAGAVTLRLVGAASVLVIVSAVGRHRRSGGPTPAGALVRAADRTAAVAFGLVLAGMNLAFYEAIARIPLGVAVTVEFTGPLCLALVSSRRLVHALWGAGAGAGVALLASTAGRRLDPVGLLLALAAGACWAAYILLSQEVGRRYASLDGLAQAMVVAALAVVPFGVAAGGSGLLRPPVLALGAAVAVLSSVIPYSLELLSLRRVSARAFGVMMSLDPAVAALAGFVVLGQHLGAAEWLALGLVAGSNLGNALADRSTPPAVRATPPPARTPRR
jgi:inner membrane transporter RhtA